jgi:membrane protease YdiL (CAAX protease family)
MNSENQQSVPRVDAQEYSVPWSVVDCWIGVALLALLDIGLLIVVMQGRRAELFQSAALIIVQLAYLLPLVLIFAWKRINWRYLGFGKFGLNTLGLGCGLLVVSYIVIIAHNIILTALGVETQGDEILKFFNALESPVWFFFVGVILAPLVEETFFRGFLFQGFRQRYGWASAMLVSSLIFAVAHLDLVALIPTFILGCVLAYMYHRSNSVWPGAILHFLVNAFGLLTAYLATRWNLPL